MQSKVQQSPFRVTWTTEIWNDDISKRPIRYQKIHAPWLDISILNRYIDLMTNRSITTADRRVPTTHTHRQNFIAY